MKITPLECSCGQEVRLPSGERLYSDCEVESLREIIKGLQEDKQFLQDCLKQELKHDPEPKPLPPSRLKAYHAYQMAKSKGKDGTYLEAWEYLFEHGPEEYELPEKPETFAKYVRDAKAYYEKKSSVKPDTSNDVEDLKDISNRYSKD